MAPSPSLASSNATPGQRVEARRPTRAPVCCPLCGESSEGLGDLYGVHRCAGCEIEFRPPLRVPIRRAGVSPAPRAGNNAWIGLAVVGALIIGAAIAAGDSQAPPELPPFTFETSEFSPPPTLDPAIFEGLTFTGQGAITSLDYEVHVSHISEDDLFSTGLVRNSSLRPVETVDVEVHCLDASGNRIASRSATSACDRLGPAEVCAWGLDARVPGVAGFEVEARARTVLAELPGLELRARFDGQGAPLDPRASGFELDLEAGRVSFALEPGLAAFGVYATVTSFDADAQVRAVKRTTWPGAIRGGSRQSRPLPFDASESVDIYEVRLGSAFIADEAQLDAPGLDVSMPELGEP